MLRSRVRSAQMLRLYAPRECLCGGAVGCSPHHRHGAMMEARRFSFKYAQKQQMPEMSQPSYIHDKRYGLFNNERNIGKSRRAASKITPLYQKHMNLWETDTDASSNRFFRSYVFGQRELHQLLGRPHGFEADEAGGKQGSSDYETRTDMRYKGIDRPAFINGHYEPEWQRTLYRNNAHGNQLSNPYSPLTAEVLGPELLQIRDAKTVHHAKAWFDRLHYLIRRHYDAVGNIGDYTSRNTQLVHQFFVAFHDALTNFDFQDAYLAEQLAAVRPKELEDLFGIFMEMEANYIHEDFCPRCSLPLASTQFCGEGEAQTPFRKHRGRWAPHQQWGKEWYDVVARRAEALWYRSTEDPFFGTPTHTQRQAEALLKVYVKAQQRARAIDFMHALRGSTEFALGKIVITEVMQSSLNTLLDTTPHQHLLTNSFQATSTPMAQAAGAAGAKKVPHSPVQMRIDLEMDKLRRQQREEGVVRVPPASWKLDTSGIVPYQLDAQQRITNWRAVKQSIEDSFMSSGLPKEAYTSLEWRGMIYWKWHLAQRGSARAGYEESLQQEQRSAQKGGSSSSVVFPDRHWYRCFNTNPDVLKRQFGVGPSGTVFTVVTQTFPDPAAVVYNDPKGGVELKFDTTADACHIYADLESGDVLKLPASDDGSTVEVVVVGVATHGPEQEWALYAMHTNPALHASEGLVELGKDAVEVSERVGPHAHTGRKADVAILDAQRTTREEFLGQIVGERGGMLYVQWRLAPGSGGDRHSYNGRGVATPLGTPEMVRQRWGQLKEQPKTEALVEPPSWLTPFRNDFAEERLKELEKGPFQRERWASLIPGKYTPKVKKFGYVQHTTQDDFMTKEYMDRLLSRQYFHNPQAFEVLPERRQKSVSFRGKWEYQRVAGLPTVDRHELENGWAPTEPISDEEVQVVEQAIKDISGRRPGNFIKSPTETQSLQLNESWWTPNAFGWAEANRAERAFVDSTEQKLTDPSRLPFGGKVPPFGTTYGIGERIRAVAEDYARGFGLGPHGHSPDNDRHPFNTLGNEEKRVQSLGFGNALVRLFEEKLGTRDVHAWALEECGNGPAEANVKHLLLSVQEWRTKGRNPSPLLADVLGRYLKEELETFNAGLPTGVPRLAIGGSGSGSGSGAHGAAASTSDGNIWSDVDRHQYGYDYVAHHQRSGEGTEAYLTSLIQRATLGGVQGDASNAGGDVNFSSHLQQQAAQNFQVELAKIVGRGIPAGLIPERPAGRNSERSSGNVVPHVHSQELSRLLQRLRVTTEDISVVMRGLANCPEHIPINTNSTGSSSSNSSSPRHAFCVPVAFLLTWAGPSSPSTSTAAKRRGGGSSGANSNTSSSFIPRGRTGGNGANKDKMLVQVLDELTRIDDGYAMDVRYTIRQNRQNPILRQEFFTAFSPVLKEPALVAQRYEEYCEGKFVPNLTVAMEVFLRFLATISTNPEKLSPGGAADYFEVGTTGRATGQYTALKLLPPTIGPFRFENTLVENIATTNLFQRYGILAGPTVVQPTAFIAPSSSSIGYHLNRREDVVQLTMRNTQLLTTALEQSAYRKDIHANPALRFLLQSKTSAGLVATFNRYFQRVAPMLNYFQEVLQHHASQAGNRQFEASNANAALGRALEGERSPTIEAEFRRNSERYWRNVLDGRHGEDARGGAMMHSGGQRSYTQRGQGSGNASSSARRGDATPSAEVNLQKALGGGPHGSSSSAAPTGGAARRSSSARSSKERLGDVLRSVGERKPSTPSGPKKG